VITPIPVILLDGPLDGARTVSPLPLPETGSVRKCARCGTVHLIEAPVDGSYLRQHGQLRDGRVVYRYIGDRMIDEALAQLQAVPVPA
jgi:hypothetical protein